jgi:spore coat polysaccharide biosynthesis protein SpsF
MRKLVACLACRLAGSRLYGKPLQNLDYERGVSILDHQVQMLREVSAVDEVVLGIAEGPANLALVEFAKSRGLRWITGDERDVLARLIACVDAADGTDVFRITTESPFTFHEMIDAAWTQHLDTGADATVVDGVPLGSGFEVFTAEALKRSHAEGDERHRSELCSLYIREHRDEFRIRMMDVPVLARRPDLRLTVDYPEDLVVCRAVYSALYTHAPLIPLSLIIAYLDAHPQLMRLLSQYPSDGRIW